MIGKCYEATGQALQPVNHVRGLLTAGFITQASAIKLPGVPSLPSLDIFSLMICLNSYNMVGLNVIRGNLQGLASTLL